MISKHYVINLEDRKDRLNTFYSFLPENFSAVETFKAVNGIKCRYPAWWNAGPGAWGCYRSHIQILENAMSSDLPSYMVFEDDCEFAEDFTDKYMEFLKHLPPDWDMFYLGGQLLEAESNPPKKINEWVYRPFNVNRTHCFAVSKKGYAYLYDFLLRRFEDRTWHIDHHLGSLHQQNNFNVYCPPKWLVAQSEGLSDICCSVQPQRYFPHPITYLNHCVDSTKCVVLTAPVDVVKELIAHHNWHCGYSLTNNCIDRSLVDLVPNVEACIRKWWYYIKTESIEESKTPFLYCPHASFTDSQLPFDPIRIEACTVQEALLKLRLGK